MGLSEDHAATKDILIWVIYTAIWGHGVIWDRTAAEDLVWVHDAAAGGVYGDVNGPC